MNTYKRSSSIFSSKENRVFFAKAAGLFFGFLFFAFFVVMPQYEESFTGALQDKATRLTSLQGPKIVFLGFSDVAFGLRSVKVQEELGIQTVNAGLDGGLGNVFAEEMARINVTPGDIYVLEHLNYADGYNWGQSFNPVTMWTAMENHWQLWPLMWIEKEGKAVRATKEMIDAFPVYFKNCLNYYFYGGKPEIPDKLYSRAAFNENGDNIFPRPETVMDPDASAFWNQEAPTVGDGTAERINQLAHWLEERGATLVISCYPVARGEFSPPLEAYREAQKALEEKLDCPVISNYEDYMFSYDSFYDYNLHLTDAGADVYTQQIIKDLKAWMAESGYKVPQ